MARPTQTVNSRCGRRAGPDIFGMRRAIPRPLCVRGYLLSRPRRATRKPGGVAAPFPPIVELWRNSARYVAAILNGATPGELPIGLPNRLVRTINLDSARCLGLEVPPAMRGWADRVIGV